MSNGCQPDKHAFKLDPTASKCVKFARRWGGSVLEVVNLFAMRSPYPKDLLKYSTGNRGDDRLNDEIILAACTKATRVIAAWGNQGGLGGRDQEVRSMLVSAGVRLEHLGRTAGGGYPMHPLARGKYHIPIDREPQVWT